MKEDVVTVPLGLPEFRVLNYEDTEFNHRILLEAVSRQMPCPRCGSMIHTWSEERWRKAQDLPIAGKPVWLEIRQRRFRCPDCGARFWEQFQSILLHQRQTRRFQTHLLMSLKGSSVSKASRDNQAGYRVVERLFVKTVEEQHCSAKPLPRKLGVDEYAPRKGQRYHTIAVAPSTGEVLDVAEGRTQASLESLLRAHPGANRVREVVIDMWNPFYRAARSVCRKARIVIDRFHVENHAIKALDQVRRRLQRHATKADKKLLKSSRHLLLSEDLSEEERREQERVLSRFPELKLAARLVKAINRWYDNSPDRDRARSRLYYWYRRVWESGLSELKDVSDMIRNWQEEILNYFLDHLTNGATEGLNTKIKLIIRTGYGFANFRHLRARILLECSHDP